ncbi:hypothetical protein HR060_10770 [Catenovulum sp. SM1970]|nr:hypothetical protein [Marinifaba aquimaris]NTS77347.1 hypothetical protein [Marinifaba aquimaris]
MSFFKKWKSWRGVVAAVAIATGSAPLMSAITIVDTASEVVEQVNKDEAS